MAVQTRRSKKDAAKKISDTPKKTKVSSAKKDAANKSSDTPKKTKVSSAKKDAAKKAKLSKANANEARNERKKARNKSKEQGNQPEATDAVIRKSPVVTKIRKKLPKSVPKSSSSNNKTVNHTQLVIPNNLPPKNDAEGRVARSNVAEAPNIQGREFAFEQFSNKVRVKYRKHLLNQIKTILSDPKKGKMFGYVTHSLADNLSNIENWKMKDFEKATRLLKRIESENNKLLEQWPLRKNMEQEKENLLKQINTILSDPEKGKMFGYSTRWSVDTLSKIKNWGIKEVDKAERLLKRISKVAEAPNNQGNKSPVIKNKILNRRMNKKIKEIRQLIDEFTETKNKGFPLANENEYKNIVRNLPTFNETSEVNQQRVNTILKKLKTRLNSRKEHSLSKIQNLIDFARNQKQKFGNVYVEKWTTAKGILSNGSHKLIKYLINVQKAENEKKILAAKKMINTIEKAKKAKNSANATSNKIRTALITQITNLLGKTKNTDSNTRFTVLNLKEKWNKHNFVEASKLIKHLEEKKGGGGGGNGGGGEVPLNETTKRFNQALKVLKEYLVKRDIFKGNTKIIELIAQFELKNDAVTSNIMNNRNVDFFVNDTLKSYEQLLKPELWKIFEDYFQMIKPPKESSKKLTEEYINKLAAHRSLLYKIAVENVKKIKWDENIDKFLTLCVNDAKKIKNKQNSEKSKANAERKRTENLQRKNNAEKERQRKEKLNKEEATAARKKEMKEKLKKLMQLKKAKTPAQPELTEEGKLNNVHTPAFDGKYAICVDASADQLIEIRKRMSSEATPLTKSMLEKDSTNEGLKARQLYVGKKVAEEDTNDLLAYHSAGSGKSLTLMFASMVFHIMYPLHPIIITAADTTTLNNAIRDFDNKKFLDYCRDGFKELLKAQGYDENILKKLKFTMSKLRESIIPLTFKHLRFLLGLEGYAGDGSRTFIDQYKLLPIHRRFHYNPSTNNNLEHPNSPVNWPFKTNRPFNQYPVLKTEGIGAGLKGSMLIIDEVHLLASNKKYSAKTHDLYKIDELREQLGGKWVDNGTTRQWVCTHDTRFRLGLTATPLEENGKGDEKRLKECLCVPESENLKVSYIDMSAHEGFAKKIYCPVNFKMPSEPSKKVIEEIIQASDTSDINLLRAQQLIFDQKNTRNQKVKLLALQIKTEKEGGKHAVFVSNEGIIKKGKGKNVDSKALRMAKELKDNLPEYDIVHITDRLNANKSGLKISHGVNEFLFEEGSSKIQAKNPIIRKLKSNPFRRLIDEKSTEIDCRGNMQSPASLTVLEFVCAAKVISFKGMKANPKYKMHANLQEMFNQMKHIMGKSESIIEEIIKTFLCKNCHKGEDKLRRELAQRKDKLQMDKEMKWINIDRLKLIDYNENKNLSEVHSRSDSSTDRLSPIPIIDEAIVTFNTLGNTFREKQDNYFKQKRIFVFDEKLAEVSMHKEFYFGDVLLHVFNCGPQLYTDGEQGDILIFDNTYDTGTDIKGGVCNLHMFDQPMSMHKYIQTVARTFRFESHSKGNYTERVMYRNQKENKLRPSAKLTEYFSIISSEAISDLRYVPIYKPGSIITLSVEGMIKCMRFHEYEHHVKKINNRLKKSAGNRYKPDYSNSDEWLTLSPDDRTIFSQAVPKPNGPCNKCDSVEFKEKIKSLREIGLRRLKDSVWTLFFNKRTAVPSKLKVNAPRRRAYRAAEPSPTLGVAVGTPVGAREVSKGNSGNVPSNKSTANGLFNKLKELGAAGKAKNLQEEFNEKGRKLNKLVNLVTNRSPGNRSTSSHTGGA